MLAARGRLASATMASLSDKVTTALNETRILRLGAHAIAAHNPPHARKHERAQQQL